MFRLGPPDVNRFAAKGDVKRLIKALDYKDKDVRWAAVSALGEIGDPRAVEPLIDALHDQDASVREMAVVALGPIDDARAVEALREAKVDSEVEQAIAVLSHDDPVGHLAALNTLQALGQPAVNALIDALHDKDKDVRRAAVSALGEIGDACSVEPLSHALHDKDNQVRRAGVSALRKIGDARAIEPLIGVLHDETSSVRRAAVEALGEIDDERASKALRDYKIKQALIQAAAQAMRNLLGKKEAVAASASSSKQPPPSIGGMTTETYMCDVCSMSLPRSEVKFCDSATMHRAVRNGLNPWKTPGISSSSPTANLGAFFGMGSDDLYPVWRERALADMTPWGLCPSCNQVVGRM